MRPQLLDMAPEALEALVQGMGERPFRARQIREALLKGLPLSEMTVLSKDLRALGWKPRRTPACPKS